MNIRKALPLVMFFVVSPAATGAGNSLSAEDIAKIKQVHSGTKKPG